MLNRKIIFEQDDIVVIHDLDDPKQPIGFRDNGAHEEYEFDSASAACCDWLDHDDVNGLIEALREVVPAPTPDKAVRASDISFNEGVLRLAAVHGRAVTFRYTKSDTSPVEYRTFVPQEVHRSQAGDVYIVGPDEDRGAVRSFRLDRIKGEVQVP